MSLILVGDRGTTMNIARSILHLVLQLILHINSLLPADQRPSYDPTPPNQYEKLNQKKSNQRSGREKTTSRPRLLLPKFHVSKLSRQKKGERYVPPKPLQRLAKSSAYQNLGTGERD